VFLKVVILCLLPGLLAIGGCRKDNLAVEVPRLMCENTVYNFGEAVNTEVIEHVFVLKNKGNVPLRIHQVKSSCQCTVGKLSKNIIQPNEETIIFVQLSLHGFRGHISKSVLVKSDDPVQPQLSLSLEGTAIEDILITPATVSFRGIRDDANVTKIISLRAENPNITFTIQKVQSDTAYFVPKLEVIEKGKSYRIWINTKPPLPEGLINGNIHVFTDNINYSTIEVPVMADVWGELVVYPEEIVLNTDNSQNMKGNTYVVIIPSKTKVFELKDVVSPSPSVQTKTVSLGQNGYRIELTVLEVTKDLNGRKLRITTNLEDMKESLIPFRVVDESNFAGVPRL